MTKLPILVLAFNRADHVAQALEPISRYKPHKIYLACDGARTNKDGEIEAVAKTRETMLKAITWPCEIKTLFRDKNLGCAKGVNEAISWFFNHEEQGIICEDDVILSDDFFKLCEILLPRYSKEDKIMQISARNTSKRIDKDSTYVYSQVFHCWGWATWKRAWEKMDMSMSSLNNISVPYLIKRLGIFRGLMMMRTFKIGFRHLESFNSWATRWYLSILNFDGLVICPGVNMALNIGLQEGTHFDKEDKNRPGFDLAIKPFNWPIEFNDQFKIDQKQKIYDSKYYFKNRMFGLKKKIRKCYHHLFMSKLILSDDK